MALTLILFVVGFLLLIKGADFFVQGSAALARRFRISELVIGLTLVAFGTSLPELVVNLFASAEGRTDLAIGNVLGSNTFNIFAILGIAAILIPLRVHRGTTWKEIPLSLLAAVAVGIAANDGIIDGAVVAVVSRTDGLLFLGFFSIFLAYVLSIARQETGAAAPETAHPWSMGRAVVAVVAGLGALIWGGRWVVLGAVAGARMLGVSESLIGLTIVAVGTSLPELATSVLAARRGSMDIAVGNVVGSNIFNIFFILGVSALLHPLPFAAGQNFDILVTVFASAALFATMFVGKRHTLERWQGALLLGCYVGYVGYLLVRG